MTGPSWEQPLEPVEPDPVEEPSPAPGRRRRGAVALAVGLVVCLLGGGAVAVSQRGSEARRVAAEERAQAAAEAAVEERERARSRGILRTLEERSAAVLRRDRAAFLRLLDPAPAAAAFRRQQAQVFDGLVKLPLASWDYRVQPDRGQVADARVDRLRGPGWWAPEVSLRYALKGYDTAASSARQVFTFVPRGNRWLLASDDDFGPVGQASVPGIWDGGELVVVTGKRALVLGHPRSRQLLREVAETLDAAVPRVTRVVGNDWAEKVVVLVPDDTEELQELLDSRTDFSRIAAVATAQLGEAAFVGERILVNPPNFRDLGTLGRRVVLTHEVTHVATRTLLGPATPTWLSEGFADHVGFSGLPSGLRAATPELRAAVRAGKVPTRLPGDGEFEATNAGIGVAYEASFLAVRRLVDAHGAPKVLRFFRAVRDLEEPAEGAVASVFRATFDQDLRAFERGWSASLRTLR